MMVSLGPSPGSKGLVYEAWHVEINRRRLQLIPRPYHRDAPYYLDLLGLPNSTSPSPNGH